MHPYCRIALCVDPLFGRVFVLLVGSYVFFFFFFLYCFLALKLLFFSFFFRFAWFCWLVIFFFASPSSSKPDPRFFFHAWPSFILSSLTLAFSFKYLSGKGMRFMCFLDCFPPPLLVLFLLVFVTHTPHWGEEEADNRGPVMATTRHPTQRNAIGAHSGSYCVYKVMPRYYQSDHFLERKRRIRKLRARSTFLSDTMNS